MSDEYKATETLIRDHGVTRLILEDKLDIVNFVPLFNNTETGNDETVDGNDETVDGNDETIDGNDKETVQTVYERDFPSEVLCRLRNFNKECMIEVDLGKESEWMNEVRCFAVRDSPGAYLFPGLCSRAVIEDELRRAVEEYPYLPQTTNNVGPTSLMPPNPFDGKPALRWVSLGCIYDWGERAIVSTGRLPAGLETRAKDVARLLTGTAPWAAGWDTYQPDCALVNYYQKGDRLRGHTDDVEDRLDMPLVTFSFGQPALFLLGGPTRTTRPTCILLREGDVLVMAGPSRLNYHGVPQLLNYNKASSDRKKSPDKKSPTSKEGCASPSVRLTISEFRQRYRVNISVRQK